MIFPALLAAGLFLSCTDFFSSSWAAWARRDPAALIPDVTPDNVNELIELTENDPDLSLELLKKIGEAVQGASGDDKAALQAAAVAAAANAVGLGQTIINAAGDIAKVTDVDEAIDAILDAINEMPNLDEVCDELFKLLPHDPSSEEFQNFIDNASPEDIALAAILLLAGEAKKAGGDIHDYIDNFDENSSDRVKLALDLTAAIADKEDELSDNLLEILKGLNLL